MQNPVTATLNNSSRTVTNRLRNAQIIYKNINQYLYSKKDINVKRRESSNFQLEKSLDV